MNPIAMPAPPIPAGGGRDAWSPPREVAPPEREAAVWGALDEVLDPELPISLVELGLVYGVEVDSATVRVMITYTATGCPCMDFIREDVSARLEQEPWVDEVRIDEVWSPPWTTARITESGRAKLKSSGVGV